MRRTQLTPMRRSIVLALLITLSFIPINDTLRAESDYDHIPSYADGKVNVSLLNVRSGPGLGYSIVGYGVWSESIYISRRDAGCAWLEVSMDDGTMGWVHSPLVELYRACSDFAIAHITAPPAAPPTATPYHMPSGHYYNQGQIYQGADGSHHYDPGMNYQSGSGHYYDPAPQYHPAPQNDYSPHYQNKSTHHYNPHAQGGTGGPVSVPVDYRNRYVNLLSPLAGDIRGLHEFSWQPSFQLGYGEAYELILWRPGQDPMVSGFSPFEATGATQVLIDLDESIRRIGQLQSGFDYVWSVLLVRPNPYQRLALLSPGHQFHLEFMSGSGGGGGPSPADDDDDDENDDDDDTETPRPDPTEALVDPAPGTIIPTSTPTPGPVDPTPTTEFRTHTPVPAAPTSAPPPTAAPAATPTPTKSA